MIVRAVSYGDFFQNQVLFEWNYPNGLNQVRTTRQYQQNDEVKLCRHHREKLRRHHRHRHPNNEVEEEK